MLSSPSFRMCLLVTERNQSPFLLFSSTSAPNSTRSLAMSLCSFMTGIHRRGNSFSTRASAFPQASRYSLTSATRPLGRSKKIVGNFSLKSYSSMDDTGLGSLLCHIILTQQHSGISRNKTSVIRAAFCNNLAGI